MGGREFPGQTLELTVHLGNWGPPCFWRCHLFICKTGSRAGALGCWSPRKFPRPCMVRGEDSHLLMLLKLE